MKNLPLGPKDDFLRAVTRRHFFRQTGFGIGSAALTSLISRIRLEAESAPLETVPQDSGPPKRGPHYPAKAKSIIYLFMAGAPSQVDLFDSKPMLQELDGKPIPDSFVKGERFAFIKGMPKLLGSPYRFTKSGQC